jgi:dephospho-CoA kinase
MNIQMNNKPVVIRKIGLTGGMGSGKSSVAKLLTQMIGGKQINADHICRKILQPNREGWREFVAAFGTQYLLADKSINRVKLRNAIFSDGSIRDQVNGIIHPIVKEKIVSEMASSLELSKESRVVVEVPLLYEVQWEYLFDTVVVVYADYDVCLNRLTERDGMDRVQAKEAMESQMDLAEKVLKADHVIDNSGSILDTHSQVEHLAAILQNNGDC